MRARDDQYYGCRYRQVLPGAQPALGDARCPKQAMAGGSEDWTGSGTHEIIRVLSFTASVTDSLTSFNTAEAMICDFMQVWS